MLSYRVLNVEPVNPIVRIYIELQGTYIRGSLIVYIVVPHVIYAKSRHKNQKEKKRKKSILAPLTIYKKKCAKNILVKSVHLQLYRISV